MTPELSTVTRTQMEQAFEVWESGFRVNPSAYRTEEETSQLSVSTVSAERADYFFELLKLEQAKA